jgi:chromosome segregation ATPase
MAKELNSSLDMDLDLDRTDRLPIIDASLLAPEEEDETLGLSSSSLDHTAELVGGLIAAPSTPPEFMRVSGVDLPSLAESVRSVEERIARQNAEYEALTRAYERAREAESAAVARANALSADLAAMKAALELEAGRTKDLDRAVSEKANAVEAARTRVEEALREVNRYQSESLTLRDSLAARDATIKETAHSLGERDAQLSALQAEHAKIVPVLESTSKTSKQLDADLRATREQANSLAAELDSTRGTVTALTAQLKRGETLIKATRADLGAEKSKATSFLELLRSRDWRRGFDLNMFREMDAKVGAAHVGLNALEADRDRLKAQVAELESQLAEKTAAMLAETTRLSEAMKSETTRLSSELEAEKARLTAEMEAQKASLTAEMEAQKERLTAELAANAEALKAAREHAGGEAARVAELLEDQKRRQTEQMAQLTQLKNEQAAQIERLKAEAETSEQEMAVLMVHLKEARRPIELIEADVRRLTEELAAKSAAHSHAEEENRKLTATLERTRGALEEREFLIRRLERSESNNANVLGRIQTSIERLGAVPMGASPISGATPEFSAELIRVDGDRPVTHVLSRRTRIGRAAGCELQIESNSVSRHHAMVLVGPREAIIEDLNSTNGVVVNGRKVSRHLLSDGDAVAIGDIQFRYLARVLPRAVAANAVESNG